MVEAQAEIDVEIGRYSARVWRVRMRMRMRMRVRVRVRARVCVCV